MAEFVVIGGGVVGCGLAWELARRGAGVTLLERAGIAAGASGGPGRRGVRANGRDLRELPLMRLAYDAWPALGGRIGTDIRYERTGGLQLVERDVTGAVEARTWAQRRAGIPTTVLAREEVVERVPDVSGDVRRALFCPLDGTVDHHATTVGLAAAARRLGAEIREHTVATAIEFSGGRAGAVQTGSGKRIPVGRGVFVAANADAAALLPVNLPVWRVVPQVAFVTPSGAVRLDHLIGHTHRPLSLKHTANGTVMISGGGRGRWIPTERRGEPVPDTTAGLLREAGTVVHTLRGARLSTVDASRPESTSIDAIPILDHVPGSGNTWVAAGWSGHGFAIAPVAAELLVDWALTGTRSPLLAPFGYNRF